MVFEGTFNSLDIIAKYTNHTSIARRRSCRVQWANKIGFLTSSFLDKCTFNPKWSWESKQTVRLRHVPVISTKFHLSARAKILKPLGLINGWFPKPIIHRYDINKAFFPVSVSVLCKICVFSCTGHSELMIFGILKILRSESS